MFEKRSRRVERTVTRSNKVLTIEEKGGGNVEDSEEDEEDEEGELWINKEENDTDKEDEEGKGGGLLAIEKYRRHLEI